MCLRHTVWDETRPSSPTQPEHLNTSVLPEMMIECEGSRDAAGVEQGKRNRIAQGPVFVGVLSQNLSGALLFGGERAQDRQPARQQPLASYQSSELSHEERVGFRLDIVGDEARPPLGRDVTGHGHRARMVRIISVEQRKDRARIPENAADHRSRMACLSRAPGVLPPPRPAPTRRNIGWSRVKDGICAAR